VPDPSPRLTCPKAADYLAQRHGVSVTDDYVRRLTRTGELPSLRLSERKLLIATDDLDAWVERGRTPAHSGAAS
jgi:excisionase family DNA binding protein